MNKITRKISLSVIILSILLTSLSLSFASEALDLEAEGALLIDSSYDTILYEKNMNNKLFPASTTKIMTAILTLENADLNQLAKVDSEVISLTVGSHIALDYDEEMTIDNLLHALMIASANDAAMVLAKSVSGSIDEFVDFMNEKAKEIGAVNTNFVNPSGLHDENHYTTPHDLYLIAKYAMDKPQFRELASMDQYIIPPTNKKEERLIHTTNRFLRPTGQMKLDGDLIPIKYQGVIGGKTGYTPEAGNCLVTFASKGDRDLFSIVLNSKQLSVYSDSYKLLDHGYNDFSIQKIASKNEFIDNIVVDKSKLGFIPAVIGEDLYYPLAETDSEFKSEMTIDEDLELPIAKGDSIGVVKFLDGDKLIGTSSLVSTIDAEPLYANFLEFLASKWYFILFGLYAIIKLAVLFTNFKRRSSRKSRRSRDINFIK